MIFLLAWATVAMMNQCHAMTQGCGRTSLSVFGNNDDNDANLGQYPSACNLFTERKGFRVFLGGASLIQQNQVLTLATLVHRLNQTEEGETDFNIDLRGREEPGGCGDSQLAGSKMFVTCGNVDLQADETELTQTRLVSRILLHPEYSPSSLINDLAVLLVDVPFKYTTAVSQICLPEPSQEIALPGDKCIAVGNGLDGFTKPNSNFLYNRKLRQVSLPIWENSKCEETLNREHFESKHGITWKIHPSFICAGGEEGKDTCQGDGGGPLICAREEVHEEVHEEEYVNDEDYLFGSPDPQFDLRQPEFDLRTDDEPSSKLRLIQAGITAWGIQCGSQGIPAAYSNVENAVCWLDQVMSCFPSSDLSNLINLRSNSASPTSANGLIEGQCSVWMNSQEADEAACGCRQSLNGERVKEVSSDFFNLRRNPEGE